MFIHPITEYIHACECVLVSERALASTVCLCVCVCDTSHLHVSAAHSYKQNSGIHKVLKSRGLARRLWLQLSPWQRQPVERLCLRAPFIDGRSNAFISSRANASISLAQLMSSSSMGNTFCECSKWGSKGVENKNRGRCLEDQTKKEN